MMWQMRLLSTLVVSDEEGDGPQLRRQEMDSLGHRRFVEMAAQTQPKVSTQPCAAPNLFRVLVDAICRVSVAH